MSRSASEGGRALLLIMLAHLAVNAPLTAAQEARVVILTDDAPEIAIALVAELGAVELSASRGEVSPRFEPESLESSAAALRASVLVAMRRAERGLEVWVVDRITRKLVRRVLALEDLEPRIVALQVLELVRASFLEVNATSFDASVEVPAPVSQLAASALSASVDDSSDRASLLLTARVGGAVSLDPGGLDPGAHVDVELALRLDLDLSLSAWLIAPTEPLVARAPEGIARTTVLATGLGAHVHLLPSSSVLDVRLGACLGVLYLRAEGVALTPFEGRIAEVLSASVAVDARVAVWLVEWLALDLTLVGLVALPTPNVIFIDRSVASWGFPAFALSLGVSARLGS